MKIPPPPYDELLDRFLPEKFFKILRPTSLGEITSVVNGKYLHWDEIRHRTPPTGLTHDEWWCAIKTARLTNRRFVPLKDAQGQEFSYVRPDVLLEAVHHIDRQASGQIQLDEEVTNPQTRDRYIVNSLIEEAITSSQLEGASTTRKAARDMLRSGRTPRDHSERMILNNYKAI